MMTLALMFHVDEDDYDNSKVVLDFGSSSAKSEIRPFFGNPAKSSSGALLSPPPALAQAGFEFQNVARSGSDRT